MSTMHPNQMKAPRRKRGIDEAVLDYYLQSPDRLDEETRRAVEQHLRKDAAARARVISFLYFYEEPPATERPASPSC